MNVNLNDWLLYKITELEKNNITTLYTQYIVQMLTTFKKFTDLNLKVGDTITMYIETSKEITAGVAVNKFYKDQFKIADFYQNKIKLVNKYNDVKYVDIYYIIDNIQF